MKKTIVFLLMASAVLLSWSACKKSEGISQLTVDESKAVPVLFGSSLQSSVSTRTRAALDKWSGNEDLYIYGLRRLNGKYVLPEGEDPYADGDPNAYLIHNVMAKSPSGNVTHGDINVYRIPGEYFYYRETPYYYSFYAYYVDNAHLLASDTEVTTPQPEENSNTISLKVDIGDNEAINKKGGTQDIMLAHTNRVADEEKGTQRVDTSRVYGAYAARRGIKPNLIFKHQLACFDFILKAGTSLAATSVTVQSLKVFSKTSGTLVIASNDTLAHPRGIFPDTPQDSVALTVQGASGALTLDGRNFGSILVMPGEDVYVVELKIKQAGYSLNGGVVSQYVKIKFNEIMPSADGLPTDDKAVGGHKYNVTMKVYGLEPVEIEATMAPWEDNYGSFNIDPDEWPE
ncbi:MAG: fimbrillin family protein [Bacteroidales bacterium]|nr:fimbrillin family protein [Bacteroidales bacterium]